MCEFVCMQGMIGRRVGRRVGRQGGRDGEEEKGREVSGGGRLLGVRTPSSTEASVAKMRPR